MLPNLLMLVKQTSLSLTKNLALATFRKLLKASSTKVNLSYLLCLMVLNQCLLHLTRESCLLKSFVKTRLIMNQVLFYLLFLLKPMLNCEIIFL